MVGNRSSIFIPPENAFNNDTFKAMQQNGIKVISTAGYAENAFDGGKNIFNASNILINQSNGVSSSSSSSIFHLPETSSFKNYEQGKWIKNPINSIIGNVTDNINKYGYAVIVLHPQDFVKLDNNNTFTNQVDENQIKDLSALIDYFVSKNIPIASFSKAIGLQGDPCISGFTITGYFTPFETDYPGQKKVTINLGSVGNKEFDENFIKDVKVEGWGKTKDGSYIGFHDGKWHQSPNPLNSNGHQLIKGSAAVDNRIISNLKQLTIPTLVAPYNNETFSANDVGGAIKGKHIDIYTGEGKAAETETKRITGENNVVCYT
jgi:3D (Asp-Asp-Asp) domain-containing protein